MARCLATRSSRSQQSLCAIAAAPLVMHSFCSDIACMHADVTQGNAAVHLPRDLHHTLALTHRLTTRSQCMLLMLVCRC